MLYAFTGTVLNKLKIYSIPLFSGDCSKFTHQHITAFHEKNFYQYFILARWIS